MKRVRPVVDYALLKFRSIMMWRDSEISNAVLTSSK